ncbi:uncharacterized membrane protein YjjP (DUF1212 family) [Acetoanaerobium pronyense]|uniref:Uncharacterized membrane protein YjjP (DUF1212 family) n=1 Tax=Acetoanaerobium pronyense TaxID=1482736 RepID=A0ABS4KIQ2_9FIRM|nr:threonine/serine exporter family protein [Acetoanaerobium pronyense]MBP2027639.1 uncharacterized membrane protein YjjP (DUF1212 family) [Acetoanaerobium pronyense]
MNELTELNKKKILRLALYAGEIMLKNGAETYRVEDTIIRICKSKRLKHVSAFVTPTVIMVSDDRFDGFSFIKTIRSRKTDLNKISLINDFSRDFVSSSMDIETGLRELKKIEKATIYSISTKVIWSGIASAMFALLFGGSLYDFVGAFLISMLAMVVSDKLNQLSETSFLANAAAGVIIGVVSIIFKYLIAPANIDMIIVGSIMPLLPGVGLTNGIRDFISGDLISGLSRVSEAMLVAVSIAVGVGTSLSIWINIGGTL